MSYIYLKLGNFSCHFAAEYGLAPTRSSVMWDSSYQNFWLVPIGTGRVTALVTLVSAETTLYFRQLAKNTIHRIHSAQSTFQLVYTARARLVRYSEPLFPRGSCSGRMQHSRWNKQPLLRINQYYDVVIGEDQT